MSPRARIMRVSGAALYAAVISGGLCFHTSLSAQSAVSASGSASSFAAQAWQGFVENRGQWESRVRFMSQDQDLTLWIENSGATLGLIGRTPAAEQGMDVLRIAFEGPSSDATVEGHDELAGRSNYFLGADPSGWHTRVPAYRSVTVKSLEPGVDVTWYRAGDRLAFDLTVWERPQGGAITLRYDGAESVEVSTDGAVLVRTRLGILHQSAPVSWLQDASGKRLTVDCQVQVQAGHRLSIGIPEIPVGAHLVIDPGLEWASYLGTNKPDRARDISIASNGDLIVVGQTTSPDFPVTAGSYDSSFGPNSAKAFVTRLRPADGELVYSTYLGGTKADGAIDVAIGAGDEAVVMGGTGSADFPTTPGALKTTQPGIQLGDGFVTRLTADGSGLVYSTLLGGSDSDFPTVMALGSDGTVTIAGNTFSQDFPVTANAYQTTKIGPDSDVFVTRLGADASNLICSTFIGGAFGDSILRGLGVASDGSAVIAGMFGVDVAPTTIIGSGASFEVAKLNPDFSAVNYITRIGSGANVGVPLCAALDAQGHAIITGHTLSTTMPVTPGVLQPVKSGSAEGFVLRLNPTGTSIEWCTYLGGVQDDHPDALHVDGSGVITIAGWTGSANFPVTPGAWKTSQNTPPQGELYALRMSPDASKLYYSTYVGGPAGGVTATGMDVGPAGEVALAAVAPMPGFPTTRTAFDSSHNGLADAVIALLSMLPTGVEKLGSSTPGCAGPLAIGVTAMPRVASPRFALTCSNVEPGAAGWLVLGAAPASTPTVVKGAGLWLHPTPLLQLLPVQAPALGELKVYAPIPGSTALIGLTAYAQFVWNTRCPADQLCASNALAITVQP